MRRNLELAFKVIYLLLTFVSFNVLFARHWYIPYISYAVVGFGIVVGTVRLFRIKNYLNAGIFLLLSFVFSYILGAINTVYYGYMDNIKAVIWMLIQYFIIFAFDKTKDVKNERDILFKVYLLYTGIAAIVSMWMMVTKWTYYSRVEEIYWVQGGFIDNRLFGCYTDPNYGAIIAIVSIVLSLYFLIRDKDMKKIYKVLLIMNIVFEYLYICYSDSRTGLLGVAACSFSLVFVWLSN